ncbi:hypothetical protein DPMN_022104 [Dreissena polymorpha]|uniref:Uncharacterized protein n=1 Tax=Dreissena polymorpha TaxID=45954 RepID=A0A9D4NNB2_DREPO|nr:hypothetical protein DPMN_022104 [Dreissena polymorpha]
MLGHTPGPHIMQERNALPCRLYSRDDNAVSTAYILASISTHLPDFIRKDRGMQKDQVR